ncbi:acetylornithine deacetylase [Rhodobacteraceae bacterium nBUS_24]
MVLVDILSTLVGFRTIAGKPNLDLIDWVEAFLQDADFTVTRFLSPCGSKAGLLAKFGGKDGGVLFSAHSDVVPVSGQCWNSDPFTLKHDGDRLIGRGTTDMKGFLACVLAEAQALKAHTPEKPFMVSLSWDEEIGCRGIPHMIDHVIPTLGRPNLVVVGEPTEMQICLGHKGKTAYRAVCHGTTGHSALAPKFLNALHVAADFIVALQKLQQSYASTGVQDLEYAMPYSTLHAGKMQGGVALNMVPERAEIEFEIRHLSADNPNDMIDALRNFAPQNIEIEQVNSYPGFDGNYNDPIWEKLVRSLDPRKPIKVSFGTEAGFFSNLGLRTLVCGPGSMQADGHQPNEGIATAQLQACHRFIQKVML